MTSDVELRILPSFARNEKWKTNAFIDLVVHEERPNAIRFSATGVTPDHEVCWYCNKPLTTEESQILGVGPVCAKTIGIPQRLKTVDQINQWYDTAGRLEDVWVPRRVIKFPHHLRMAIADDNSESVNFKAWTDEEDCNGVLTIGYRPTNMHHRYENLICLEIFCEMGLSFHSELLSVQGSDWHGGDHRTPSWRNARDIGKDKVWTFPFSSANALSVMKSCENWGVRLEVDQELVTLLQTRNSAKKQRSELVAGLGIFEPEEVKKMTPEDLDKVDWDKLVSTDPWAHQKAAIVFAAMRMNLTLPLLDNDD